jgi:tetratricopeptide (TPR) repeat protein
MMVGRILCTTLVLLAFALPAWGQDVRRPKLDSKADTNDWEAYYDYGVENLQRHPDRAYDAFYWAARLAPWSGDPLYAQWVAFHLRDVPRFALYLDNDPKVLTAPAVRAVDSSVSRAFLRNPFVHRALEMALYDALPGGWRGDVLTKAWLAYTNQRFDQANELFGKAIAQKPDRYYRLRHIRAVLFVTFKQYDSAITEITALLDKARAVESSEKELVRAYESKAFYEFAIGQLEASRGNRKAAREAFERALTEDLAYAPAHVALGALSEGAGQREAALASYAQAVDLAPADAVYRQQYASALLKARRAQDAIDQLNQAIALERYYAESYVFKARAHEMLQQPDSARSAYQIYLMLAARNAPNRGLATQRLASLAP